MTIFDSHAHYDDTAFDADRDELLGSLPASGVTGVVNCGVTLESSLASVRLAQRYDYIYAAAGFQPEEVTPQSLRELDRIGEIATSEKKVVAIGEIGLDYHYEGCDRELQLRVFEAELAMANELHLPVVVHDRDAHADTLRLLKAYKPQGVLHCYSGSVEMAQEVLKLGFYLGFTGVVTFKNSRKAAEVIASLPHNRLLIETDCPYMAPVPLRGRRSDSSMLCHTLARVAELLGITPDEAGTLTAANAKELFQIR